MNLFYRNNIQVRDGGPIDPPCDDQYEAVEEEFEFLIRDPGTIEAAFNEGILVDAIACSIWAQLADSKNPTFYEAVAKRIEAGMRRKVWEFAEANVKERAAP